MASSRLTEYGCPIVVFCQPEVFKFADHRWFCDDRPEASRLAPAMETGGDVLEPDSPCTALSAVHRGTMKPWPNWPSPPAADWNRKKAAQGFADARVARKSCQIIAPRT
jgi:hypothetical protein